MDEAAVRLTELLDAAIQERILSEPIREGTPWERWDIARLALACAAACGALKGEVSSPDTWRLTIAHSRQREYTFGSACHVARRARFPPPLR